MAVLVFGLSALLAVFNTRVSYGAAAPSTRLHVSCHSLGADGLGAAGVAWMAAVMV